MLNCLVLWLDFGQPFFGRGGCLLTRIRIDAGCSEENIPDRRVARRPVVRGYADYADMELDRDDRPMMRLLILSVVIVCAPNMVRASCSNTSLGGGVVCISSLSSAPGVSGGTTSSINTSGANFLACFISNEGTYTFSDAAGNTWVPLTAYQGSTSDIGGQIQVAVNAKTNTTETFTVGSAIAPAVSCVALSGILAFNSGTDSGNDANSGQSSMAPVASITGSGAVIVLTGVTTESPGTGTLSINDGFSVLESIAYAAGSNYGAALAYLVQIPGAAVQPTWQSTSSGITAVAIGAFNLFSGGSKWKKLYRGMYGAGGI